MKKIALILTALLTGASLSANDAPASSYSVSVDFPYASKYVFRGIELAEGSFQPSVKLTSGNFYAGIWSSLPTDDGYEAEVDYYGGYNFTLDGGLTLDVGATIYHYPELDVPGADTSTFEGYVGLNGSIQSVNLGVYAYNDFTLKIFTIQGNLGYSIPVNEKVSMNIAASVGRSSPEAADSYTYYSLGAQFPYAISDNVTFTAGANWASHDISGVDKGHVWFNAGLSASF